MLTAAMVVGAFDLGEPARALTEVSGSAVNRTWRLDTFGGSYFVKHYDRPLDMPTWSDWIRYVQGSWEIERAALDAGLPVAVPILAPGAAWPWIDLDVDGDPATVRIHRWVPGTLRRDPVSPAMATQLGGLLGRIHQLLPTMSEWRRPPTWPEDWSHVAPRGERPLWPWNRTFLDALPLLERASALCSVAAREPLPLVRTHRDLHSHNVIERADGTAVIVDWDAASTQRADWELVETALELAGYITGPPSRAVVDAVVTAYRGSRSQAVRVTPSSFAGLLMCSQNWLRYNIRRVMGRQHGADPTAADHEVEIEVIRSLAAVQRVYQGIDEWIEWFA
jgi:Ser/Thr protein kinase RdoA (MazF antagonist)